MTEENDKDFKNSNICRFCETNFESDKVRDHCHLTGKYRGPAHTTCNRNVKQKDSNFIPFFSQFLDLRFEYVLQDNG